LTLGVAATTGAAVAAAAAGAALLADCGFSVTACCFLHIEKFSASSNGRNANLIIIGVVRDYAQRRKTQVHFIRDTGNMRIIDNDWNQLVPFSIETF
jgi:hypothetical protein